MRRQIETEHCVAFLNRLAQYHPELYAAIYHCPNESSVRQRTDNGIKPGQPDYCLPIPRGSYGALYLEFKKPTEKTKKGGGLSAAQVDRIAVLEQCGNKVVVVYSWQEGVAAVVDYLSTQV